MKTLDITLTVPAALKKLGDDVIQIVADVKAKKNVTTDIIGTVEDAVLSFAEVEAELKGGDLEALGLMIGLGIVRALQAPTAAAPSLALPLQPASGDQSAPAGQTPPPVVSMPGENKDAAPSA